MTQNLCSTCSQPIPDTAFGCPACGGDLAQKLDHLAGLIPELETTVARLDRIGRSGAGAPPEDDIPSGLPNRRNPLLAFGWSASREKPGSGALRATGMPFSVVAADGGRAIQGELVTWARHIIEETGREPATSSGSAVARFLAQNIGWLRHRQEWPEAYAALRPLLGEVLFLVDRPVERTYVGPCSHSEDGEVCGVDVYARLGATHTVCRNCETEYVVADCQAWMREQLRDLLARAVEISGMLARLGLNVTYRRIMKFVEKGQLLEHGYDTRARPLYRMGDVLEIIARNEQPRRAGQSSRGYGQPVERLTRGA